MLAQKSKHDKLASCQQSIIGLHDTYIKRSYYDAKQFPTASHLQSFCFTLLNSLGYWPSSFAFYNLLKALIVLQIMPEKAAYFQPKVYILAWLRQRGHNSLSSITSTNYMTSIQNKVHVHNYMTKIKAVMPYCNYWFILATNSTLLHEPE